MWSRSRFGKAAEGKAKLFGRGADFLFGHDGKERT
jgi:hypothetical protein